MPALVVHRASLRDERLVYLAVANRAVKYPMGRSRIVYIGTTKNGVWRIATSAAAKGRQLLRRPGIKSLTFYCVTCPPRPGLASWKKLERGLLLAFKDEFGAVPTGNTVGKNKFWDDEHLVFNRRRLLAIVDHYSRSEEKPRARRARGSRKAARKRK